MLDLEDTAAMVTVRKVITFLTLLVTLVSCATVGPTTSPISPDDTRAVSPIQGPTATSTSSPTQRAPAADVASVHGRVLDATTSGPIPSTAVRLAEVYRSGGDGAFVLDDASSPATLTDQQGYFVIEDVEPKEYVVVVGDVHIAYEIVAEPSGEARVWELRPGEVTDIGVLEIVLD